MQERHIVTSLTAIIISIGLVTVATTIYSVNKIETSLIAAQDFHTKALFEILGVNEGASVAIQESFAFLLSGDPSEKREFDNQVAKVNEALATFEVTANLNLATEQVERDLFDQVETHWQNIKLLAVRLFEEQATSGAISQDTLADYELQADRIGRALDQFIQIERAEVESAQANSLQTIAQAEKLVLRQGSAVFLLTLLVAAIAARMLSKVFASREVALRELRLYKEAVGSATMAILFCDAEHPEMPIVYVNKAFEEITGYASAEVVGQNCRFLQGPLTDKALVAQVREGIEQEKTTRVVLQNYRKNGEIFWNDLSITPVHSESNTTTHFVGVINDMTDRLALEHQLLQSQKMDAVGQLAGGIAHDFNNYLTVINGAAELLTMGSRDEIEHWSEQILEAGHRSAALTAQLLAFARQQVMDPQTHDINEIVSSLLPLLQRTIREDIKLEPFLGSDVGLINIDRSQLEQVITNLVLNSRDAMPDGGTITIETGDIFLSAEYANTRAGVEPGKHVMLAVSDTGTGIDPAVKDTVFEPFVTTKELGKGTGLGLSTVYGIVKQSGGELNLYSEVGHGTTIKIYFRCIGVTSARDKVVTTTPEFVGEGCVLLVEDDDMVRPLVRAMLEAVKYTVVEAEDGLHGLELLRQRDDFALIVTDITMPEMSGVTMAAEAKKLYPDLPVLFMSGYTQNGIVHHGKVDPGHVLLQKPFSRGDLNRKLLEVTAKKP